MYRFIFSITTFINAFYVATWYHKKSPASKLTGP